MHSIANIRRQRPPAERTGRLHYVPRKALRDRAPGLTWMPRLSCLFDTLGRQPVLEAAFFDTLGRHSLL